MSIEIIITLLSGLGAFLVGFKILSESIEKLATRKLKNLFNKTSKNKLVGVGIGLGTTAIVQSSSATTVMVVGFVNAGVMSLAQATTIIMGANIGTTVTAQIVALQSFDLVKYASVLAAIGIFMNLMLKSDRKKTVGYALAGLGLVFVGLNVMSEAMAGFKDNEAIISAFKVISNPFLLLLLGILFTALVQSSSAVTSIIISLSCAGVVIGNGGNSVLFLILGTNIGTCITAIISSIGANKNAKRASLIHLMFNVFGSIIFMIFLLLVPNFMDDFLAKIFSEETTRIAMFHTLFNVTCTIIFLPLSNYFVKLSLILIKDDKNSDTIMHYMDERLLSTPFIALTQIKKEIGRLEKLSVDAMDLAFSDFVIPTDKHNSEVINQIKKNTLLNEEIIKYLITLSSKDITIEARQSISFYHHTLSDIMRINEIADNIMKYTKDRIDNNLDFKEEVIESVKYMYDKVKELSLLAYRYFTNDEINLKNNVDTIENEIDDLKQKLIEDHINRLNANQCRAENCNTFICLVSNLERVADHLTNMTNEDLYATI